MRVAGRFESLKQTRAPKGCLHLCFGHRKQEGWGFGFLGLRLQARSEAKSLLNSLFSFSSAVISFGLPLLLPFPLGLTPGSLEPAAPRNSAALAPNPSLKALRAALLFGIFARTLDLVPTTFLEPPWIILRDAGIPYDKRSTGMMGYQAGYVVRGWVFRGGYGSRPSNEEYRGTQLHECFGRLSGSRARNFSLNPKP